MKKISALLTVSIFLVTLMFFGCSRGDNTSKSLTIKGSDTMVHLVSTWAEDFMLQHKDSEISVTGGGSGTGIAALLNGTTDITAASRKMKDKEWKLAEQSGIQPEEIVVARDGIAVVVNPENPVNELSIEQLGKIFTGAYVNWSKLGGPDKEIVVLSRDSSSGTYVFFQEKVLAKKDYTPKARLMAASSAIIQSVSADKWSIGYVGLGYAQEARDRVKIVAVKANADAPAIVPAPDTVKSGEYSIARPLHLYTNGNPTGLVKKFIDFCLGPEGQRIVQETGYVAISQ